MNKFILALLTLTITTSFVNATDQGGRPRSRGGAPSQEATKAATTQATQEQQVQAILDAFKADSHWTSTWNSAVNAYKSYFTHNPKPCDAYPPMTNSRISCSSDEQSAKDGVDTGFLFLMHFINAKPSPQVIDAAKEKFRAMVRAEAMKQKNITKWSWTK